MSGLIERLQPHTGAADERPRVIDVHSAETTEVIDALSSETRRAILGALFEGPSTPSELAEELDTTAQNVHYHLSALREADLVEPVGTRYSVKGNEMSVYAPANDPIVVVGDEERRSRVDRSIHDLLAGLGLLSLAALFVQWGAERLLRAPAGGGAVEPAAWNPGAGPGQTVGWLVFDVVEPGVLFFFGCLLVLVVVARVYD